MAYDAIVIGAGAAGLFSAGVLGQLGRRVLVLDHAPVIGEKIRISGGGRCNFTNRDSTYQNFLSLNPDFCRSALSRYTPADFVGLVQRHRIRFHEKHRGQLFCDERSSQIVEMLVAECDHGGVRLQYPVSVEGVRRSGQQWCVDTSAGSHECQHLVIATGGLPVPAIGATGFGLELAKHLGIDVVSPRPALVPLSFTSEVFFGSGALSGISLPVTIQSGQPRQVGHRYGHAIFSEDLLITHKGLSGPAVLQASSYWQEGEPITIDWTNGRLALESLDERAMGGQSVASILKTVLPERIAAAFADDLRLAKGKWAELAKKEREHVIASVTQWQVKPAGTLGWKKAEVMLGGVDTRSLDSKTMAAKALPNLYFIGECVDVTGHLGGHNFQWGWASGYAAAQAIHQTMLSGAGH
jgi:predicted Rossmann fold flavoprotein